MNPDEINALAVKFAPLPKDGVYKYEVGGKIPALNNMEVAAIFVDRKSGATEVHLKSHFDGSSCPWKLIYPGYPAIEITIPIPKKDRTGNEAD